MAKAEIVSIGTELLLGQILDTNSQFISTELASLGVDCLFRSTVGDNSERIVSSLKLALDRSDVVITTGGLGPTADDLTHECIAEYKVSSNVAALSWLNQTENKHIDQRAQQFYRIRLAPLLVSCGRLLKPN